MSELTPTRRIVAVRFGSLGPLAYYEAGSFDLAVGDRVLVEAEAVRQVATVVLPPGLIEVVNLPDPLATIIGRADQELSVVTDPGAVTAPCSHEPCCQTWQARFEPPPIEGHHLFCQARFAPGRYDEMRQDWPAVGDTILGPPPRPTGTRAEFEDKKLNNV